MQLHRLGQQLAGVLLLLNVVVKHWLLHRHKSQRCGSLHGPGSRSRALDDGELLELLSWPPPYNTRTVVQMSRRREFCMRSCG